MFDLFSEPSNYLAIVFFLTTLLLTLYLWARPSAYRGSIDYSEDFQLRLFESRTHAVENLTILYEGETQGGNFIILRGGFLNSGTGDIDARDCDAPLSIRCPDGTKWLEVKIAAKSNGLECEPHIEEGEHMCFNFSSLFRASEAFIFEALLSVDPDSDVASSKDAVSFHKLVDHRIANTRPVKSRGRLPSPSTNSSHWSDVLETAKAALILVAVAFVSLFVFFLAASLSSNRSNSEKSEFQFQIGEQERDYVVLTPDSADSLVLSGSEALRETVGLDEIGVLKEVLPPIQRRKVLQPQRIQSAFFAALIVSAILFGFCAVLVGFLLLLGLVLGKRGRAFVRIQ